jgi:hypothetical protein
MRPLRGAALTLEYYEPARARGTGELELTAVAHDYRDVLRCSSRRTARAAAQLRRVRDRRGLPAGRPVHDQIDATVHVLGLPSGLLCSGSLLNNTANDGSVLVLSAAHCGGLANAVFTFNFERPACGSGIAPQHEHDRGRDPARARRGARRAARAPERAAGGAAVPGVPRRLGSHGRAAELVGDHPPPGGDVKKISLDDDAPGSSRASGASSTGSGRDRGRLLGRADVRSGRALHRQPRLGRVLVPGADRR